MSGVALSAGVGIGREDARIVAIIAPVRWPEYFGHACPAYSLQTRSTTTGRSRRNSWRVTVKPFEQYPANPPTRQ